MKLAFTQLYPEAGIKFPLSHHFQRRFGQELTSRIDMLPEFEKRFGAGTTVIVYISSREKVVETEIRGPKIFKNGDIESYVYLPFRRITCSQNPFCEFLRQLLDAVGKVLAGLQLDGRRINEQAEELIASICADSRMVEGEWSSTAGTFH